MDKGAKERSISFISLPSSLCAPFIIECGVVGASLEVGSLGPELRKIPPGFVPFLYCAGSHVVTLAVVLSVLWRLWAEQYAEGYVAAALFICALASPLVVIRQLEMHSKGGSHLSDKW
eukprot:gene53175-231_t